MVSATAIVLGTAVVVATLVPRRRAVLVWCAIGYVIAMAWSRTYLRVHWLSDVVGGAAIALVIGLRSAGVSGRDDRPGGTCC